MAEIKRFGTLYFSSEAVSVGSTCPTSGEGTPLPISIGNSVPGKEIPFVEWQGKYIAAENVCQHIIWEYLNQAGYMYGKPIKVDGKQYLCRCLSGGETPEHENEWDFALDELGDSNDLWHWKEAAFWGQETGATRGKKTAWSYCVRQKTESNIEIGFRPALVPLEGRPIPELKPGDAITVYGKTGIVPGVFVEETDYNLLMISSALQSADCDGVWMSHSGNEVVVNLST